MEVITYLISFLRVRSVTPANKPGNFWTGKGLMGCSYQLKPDDSILFSLYTRESVADSFLYFVLMMCGYKRSDTGKSIGQFGEI